MIPNVTEEHPTTVTKPKSYHVAALDGVRGLAVVIVLCYHLLNAPDQPGSALLTYLLNLKATGWVGVDLFFALSGFLITGILFDAQRERRYFRNFYARRMLRIFPLYYAVVLLLIVMFHFIEPSGMGHLYLDLGYLQNTSLWFSTPVTFNMKYCSMHLWSLAVEEQFYLVWPLLIFWVKDRRRLLWLSVALAFCALPVRCWMLYRGAPDSLVYVMTFCRMDSLLAGAALALLVRGPEKRFLPVASKIGFALGAAGCGALAWKTGNFCWLGNPIVNRFGYTFVALAAASWVGMALDPGSVVARTMRLSPLRWFGKYSYGLYIFHPIFETYLMTHSLPVLREFLPSRYLVRLAILVVDLGVTVPLALVSYHYFERPFLKLKRYFTDDEQVSQPRVRPGRGRAEGGAQVVPGLVTQPGGHPVAG